MPDSPKHHNQHGPKIAPSSKASTTAVGPTEAGKSEHQRPEPDLVDAINQVFELFRINYHNQYFSAYADIETLNHAKRLWLETLKTFSSEDILRGASAVIRESEYLPTLHKMITYCQGGLSHHGLVDPYSAYIEACNKPSPKVEQQWSHWAVYYAGLKSDWFFLANNPERVALPIFKECYRELCQRVMAGEKLPAPEVKRLPAETTTALSKSENHRRLQALKEEFDL